MEQEFNHLSELAATISDLQCRGFTMDFNFRHDHLLCIQQQRLIPAEEFRIIETRTFISKPEILIYAIEAVHYGMKGILMTTRKQYTQWLNDACITRAFFFRNCNDDSEIFF